MANKNRPAAILGSPQSTKHPYSNVAVPQRARILTHFNGRFPLYRIGVYAIYQGLLGDCHAK